MPVTTELRETERRVLGNLPAWRNQRDNAAARTMALDAGQIQTVDEWPTSRTVEDLTRRLAADRHCTILAGDEPQVEEILLDLEARGLAEKTGGDWSMTQAGLGALQS